MTQRPTPDPMEAFDPLARIEGPAMPRVLGAAVDYQAGTELACHSHIAGQLIYATTGSMTVLAESELFIVPPLMAVWVAPSVAHAVTMRSRLAMRTLYFRPDALPVPEKRCGVIRVSPLLRELILSRIVQPPANNARGGALNCLIADEMQMAAFEPLALKAPTDRRVRHIASMLLEQPNDARSLADWSRTVGASPRTIERIFLRETLLTFRQWRRQARLLQAVLHLSEGKSVTTVADDVGYASQSAFTYMFRCALGVSPRHYFKKAG